MYLGGEELPVRIPTKQFKSANKELKWHGYII